MVVSRSVLKSKKRMLLVNTQHQTPMLLPQSDRRQEAYAMEQSTTGQGRGQGARTIDEFLRARVRELIEDVLQEEVTATIGTRSARSAARRGYRHGSRPRSWTVTAGTVEITVPRARLQHPDGGWTEWQSELLPRYRRMSRAVEEAVVRTYLAGTNTRRIKAALAPLLTRGPLSKSAVSRLVQRLESAFDTWRPRDLSATPVVYVYLDAVYPRVRCAGRVSSLPVLVALGITPAGDKIVLALQTSGAETGASWTALVTELATRGLRPPQLVISDGNRGLRQALTRVWPGIAHQRCVVHKQRNVVSAAPRHVQAAVRESFQAVVQAETHEAARVARDGFVRAWRKRAPRAVASLLEAHDDLLTFHAFPVSQHRSLRSTNVIERLNEEFRRRIKTQTTCPSEASVLVLFYALVASGTVRMKKICGWMDLARPTRAA
jgi:transposase-like protein